MKTKFTHAGFSLIELLMTMTVMGLLLGMATLNFTSIQHKTTLTTSVESLIADLGQQQIKAMVGDTEGRAVLDNYGIRVISTGYTLFSGTYYATGSANFTVTLPASQQISTTFSSSQLLFQKGSGEIANFSATQSAITLRDISTSEQKVITFNRYGVITGVN